MMDDKKIQEIGKRYDELPEDVRKALFSAQTSDSIFEIGKKHGLPIDKMGELADETGLVMLGMTKPSEYIRNLSQRLSIQPEKAKAIAEDINQKVFATIRESLKKIHGIIPHPPTPSPSKGEGGRRELPPISPRKKLVPENLPVEKITPPPNPPPLTVRGGGRNGEISPLRSGGGVTPLLDKEGVGGGIQQKVQQILKDHEIAKQEKKETKYIFPAENEKIPPTSPILSGKIVEETKPQVPDVFVKKLPSNDPYREPIE